MKIFVNIWNGIMKVECKENEFIKKCTGIFILCIGAALILSVAVKGLKVIAPNGLVNTAIMAKDK